MYLDALSRPILIANDIHSLLEHPLTSAELENRDPREGTSITYTHVIKTPVAHKFVDR